jgi:hypothetical protein
MANMAEHARNMLTPRLEAGEELRAVGRFQTGPFWAMILLSDLFAFAMKYYFIGVTNKRLIIVRIKNNKKAHDKDNYSIPLPDVEVKSNSLKVKLPGKKKAEKFVMNFGLQAASGMHIKEFKAALGA